MPIEVDQSNKIERTEKDTVLAFSDGERFAILIPAKVKRRAFEHLKKAGKSPKLACLILFSANLFILLRDYLTRASDPGERVVIDAEYSGHDANIRAMLLRHTQAAGLTVSAGRIVFAQVGRRSAAHVLASDVQQGRVPPGYRVTLQDLLGLL